MLRKFMNTLMLSCKRATELVEKKQVTSLSFNQRIKLSSHLLFCKACRSYEKQSLLLEKAFERMFVSSKAEVHRLNQASKEKILEIIKSSK